MAVDVWQRVYALQLSLVSKTRESLRSMQIVSIASSRGLAENRHDAAVSAIWRIHRLVCENLTAYISKVRLLCLIMERLVLYTHLDSSDETSRPIFRP